MSPSTAPSNAGPLGRRSRFTRVLLAVVALALFIGFLALGTWQVQRRTWKLALIERVDQRVHSSPVPAPGPAVWPGVDAAGFEYLPVSAQGHWLNDKTVLTQAATELGAGFWVLTPLEQEDRTQILVNRGFIPADQRQRWLPDAAAAPTASQNRAAAAPVQVQGLLRISEPHGGFLRANDPAAGRWYSRDVAAIATAQGLPHAAPYFIDLGLPDRRAAPVAVQAPPAGADPRAGMTVIRFPNSHAVYALTWYALALMVAGAAWYVARYELRLRAAPRAPSAHESQR